MGFGFSAVGFRVLPTRMMMMTMMMMMMMKIMIMMMMMLMMMTMMCYKGSCKLVFTRLFGILNLRKVSHPYYISSVSSDKILHEGDVWGARGLVERLGVAQVSGLVYGLMGLLSDLSFMGLWPRVVEFRG